MATARSEELRALAQRVADAFPPDAIEVVLTGSVSRGVANEVSDVEMLVVPRHVGGADLVQDPVLAVVHHYRVSKYDPALRDDSGAYTGDDWIMFSQIGETFGGVRLTLSTCLDVEARHLVALASFFEETGTSRVTAVGVEDPDKEFRVTEGSKLTPVEAIEATRQMLRDEGWCRLVDGDRFYIHVGWDYYLYVGTDMPAERSVALAREIGLFVDDDFPSPYFDHD